MIDIIKAIFEKHDARTFSFKREGAVCTFRVHLNDMRFCIWENIDKDLDAVGLRIDDRFDGDVNEFKVVDVKARMKELFPEEDELWNADPNCKHDVRCAPGGGVKCTKCPGWFCY
jgi:hypothetical protein